MICFKHAVIFNMLCMAALVIGMQSCTTPRYVYSAPTQNVPVITKKGDFAFGGFIAAGSGSASSTPRITEGYSRGSDFQIAYALTNRFAIMLNEFRRSENRTSISTREGEITLDYKRRLTEYGAGYLFPKKKTYSNTYFQIFVGAATGKFSINENGISNNFGYTRFHQSNISKWFIQPAVILSPGNFAASFSSRFSSVKYRNINTDYDELELREYFLENLNLSPLYFWEPAAGMSYDVLKHKGLRFEMQVGLVILLNKRFADYRTTNLALGVKLDNNLFRKKPAKEISPEK